MAEEFVSIIDYIFSSKPMHGNVVFNFMGDPIDDMSAFARGYHEAGKTLISKMEASNGYADYGGYPILFLYRHALELYLKSIVFEGAKLLGLISSKEINTENLFKRHELSPLLPAIEVIFKTLGWDGDFDVSGLKSFSDFKNLVQKLEEFDPQSYCFRYPINKGGKAALPEHFIINVINFGKGMDVILDLLDGAITELDEEWQFAAENAYLLQQAVEYYYR